MTNPENVLAELRRAVEPGARGAPTGMESVGGIVTRLMPQSKVLEFQIRMNLHRDFGESVYSLPMIKKVLVEAGKQNRETDILDYLQQSNQLMFVPEVGQFYATESSLVKAAKALKINEAI